MNQFYKKKDTANKIAKVQQVIRKSKEEEGKPRNEELITQHEEIDAIDKARELLFS
ncbi:hypothetical protein MH117_18390 [Paenibacillus sp. ACRRX]|uniref:hypothetical protein n=1 Tax=Paenibacillus sp. ACRRX TaxID=2918206 RepID=UPI001EF4EEF1|nr:hypothetical protein [Paenibacillus sp. ACRRX]MCG7409389.1 hypothetical protein [Paenibacillus sp. ACRRX]MDK8180045.1 hypothetical protein [Paenibacillus sp. UMB4589-SE434]